MTLAEGHRHFKSISQIVARNQRFDKEAPMFIDDAEHDALMNEWDWTLMNGRRAMQELEIGDDQRQLDHELKIEIEERESA